MSTYVVAGGAVAVVCAAATLGGNKSWLFTPTIWRAPTTNERKLPASASGVIPLTIRSSGPLGSSEGSEISRVISAPRAYTETLRIRLWQIISDIQAD